MWASGAPPLGGAAVACMLVQLCSRGDGLCLHQVALVPAQVAAEPVQQQRGDSSGCGGGRLAVRGWQRRAPLPCSVQFLPTCAAALRHLSRQAS